jgi:hypothetical protein
MYHDELPLCNAKMQSNVSSEKFLRKEGWQNEGLERVPEE